MVTDRMRRGTALSAPAGLAVGLAASLITTLILAALIAYFALTEKIETSAIGYGAMATVLLSSALGAWIAVGCIKRRRLMNCMMSGGMYFLALLSITALFFGGQYEGMAVTALLIFGGAGGVGLLGITGEGSNTKRRKKYRTR